MRLVLAGLVLGALPACVMGTIGSRFARTEDVQGACCVGAPLFDAVSFDWRVVAAPSGSGRFEKALPWVLLGLPFDLVLDVGLLPA